MSTLIPNPLALRFLKSALISSATIPRSQCTLANFRQFQSSSRRTNHFHKADMATFEMATSKETSGDKVVLVDFYADWCAPCKMLTPILEKVTNDPAIKSGTGLPLDLVTVDTDDPDGFELGQKFKVRALPTVIAFRHGKQVDNFVGALNEQDLRKFLERV